MTETTVAVERSVTVNAPPERAFAAFTEEIGTWWPLERAHIGSQPPVEAVLEPREGGRWFERAADGTECDWGRVLAWEPPNRLVLAWQLNRQFDYDPDFETTVEVNFEARGEVTIVHFEHRDLERMGEGAAQEFESMDGGWGMLLGLFKAKVEAA